MRFVSIFSIFFLLFAVLAEAEAKRTKANHGRYTAPRKSFIAPRGR